MYKIISFLTVLIFANPLHAITQDQLIKEFHKQFSEILGEDIYTRHKESKVANAVIAKELTHNMLKTYEPDNPKGELKDWVRLHLMGPQTYEKEELKDKMNDLLIKTQQLREKLKTTEQNLLIVNRALNATLSRRKKNKLKTFESKYVLEVIQTNSRINEHEYLLERVYYHLRQ